MSGLSLFQPDRAADAISLDHPGLRYVLAKLKCGTTDDVKAESCKKASSGPNDRGWRPDHPAACSGSMAHPSTSREYMGRFWLRARQVTKSH